MGYASARKISSDEIPVIDIEGLCNGSDPLSVANLLLEASRGMGFIYVRGHGIPKELISQARSSALDFFERPFEEKAEIRVSSSHRGWLGRGQAKMQDDAKADLKESFLWGYQDENGDTPEDHPLRGRNLWPGFLPDFDRIAMKYFASAHEVARHLMRGFALGLGLDEGFFLRTADRPLSRASYVYYPAQSESMGEDQFGVGPHTDFGVLTVLCQDSVGGLQVEDINGEWIHAPPIEDTLLVNVGDLLSRWTDGAFKSTPHRVVNRSGKERLSIVLAFDPNPETRINAKDVFGNEYEPRDKPTTCGEYLEWRFAKAFSYRSKGN